MVDVPTLKARAPHRVKVWGRRVSVAAGERTAGLRLLPAFVLVGGQRCGTTSLFRALAAHPAVLPAVNHKGVNYFDLNYGRGWAWYQGHFPLRSVAAVKTRGAGEPPVTFDASGYYSYHPHAAGRLAADLPGVKVVMMVRDPVERAFSAWKHESARGFETEAFERALRLEDERVGPELERMLADPGYASTAHRHHGYRRRGYYGEQLARLADGVGRERVHVVDSQDFFTDPAREYARLVAFLGLAPFEPASFERFNARPGTGITPGARAFLEDAYAPHDAALEAFLGQAPSWRRGA